MKMPKKRKKLWIGHILRGEIPAAINCSVENRKGKRKRKK